MPIKYYRLRKNLPTFKAGEVFFTVDGGNLVHDNDNVVAYNSRTLDKFPNILTDWFEEVKEPTRWKPEIHQVYRYINTDGYVHGAAWTDDYFDNGRFKIGNCFKTEEEAKQVLEYLKALAVVRGDATTKFTRGKCNWYVCYDADSNCLNVVYLYYHINNGIFGLPYFAMEKDAQRSIYLHKNEWLTIFGGKEKE